eukprot:gnl/TRDRNA2_/TRDRNA2_175095_c0_seq19.p2 gnl/TRDRNA2_/TRDRNA2_175095_c0~~gnl/TRDRNA2_/TRDRNA2_175095_c0_seq19.p2  ORF type:complete len:340 (-),score=55.59 gnl/TRDRNA2_/TRDRNA2_175095_c0_seq19:81-1100(-)
MGQATDPAVRQLLRTSQLPATETEKCSCRKANAVALELLSTGRKIEERDLVRVLDLWSFGKNTSRANVMPPGVTWVESDMLGVIRLRMYVKYTVAKLTRQYPAVTKIVCRFLEDNPPAGLPEGVRFPYTTICINKNYGAKRHRDKNNVGLSVVRALGNFTGGRLRVWPNDPGSGMMPDVTSLDTSESQLMDVQRECCIVDSTKAHEVEEFRGQRYSLVFFTVSGRHHVTEEQRATLGEYGLEFPAENVSEDLKRKLCGHQAAPGRKIWRGSNLRPRRVAGQAAEGSHLRHSIRDRDANGRFRIREVDAELRRKREQKLASTSGGPLLNIATQARPKQAP